MDLHARLAEAETERTASADEQRRNDLLMRQFALRAYLAIAKLRN